MPLNDIKEITIPEGSVKKIENSNGDIIWGSQSAFPYRRLEYIHFSGAEYVNTNKTLTGPKAYKRFLIKLRFQNTNKWSLSGTLASGSSIAMGTRTGNLTRFALGGGASNTTNSYTVSENTIYIFELWVNSSNNNNLSISNENGTNLWTSSALSASWSSNIPELYIGATNENNTASYFMEADIYTTVIRQPNYSTIIFNGIPCQRKSDGVCGIYDTISGTFKPMQGTTITDAAAGPVIDEYWDLTA